MKRLNLLYFTLFFSFLFLQCEKQEIKNTKNTEDISSTNLEDGNLDFKEYLISKGYNTLENQVSNTTASVPCYTPSPDCLSIDKTDTIFIQGYCGDSVKAVVDYTIYICAFTVDFIIDRAYPIECDSLLSEWGTLSEELVIALDKFYYQASLVIEEKFLRENLPSYFKCPNFAITSSFYNSLCYTWCVVIGGDPGSPVLMSWDKLYCGEMCCRREKSFCWNKKGELVISKTKFYKTGSGDCDNSFGAVCRRGRIIGDCETKCGVPR